jgi:hypothetical protein
MPGVAMFKCERLHASLQVGKCRDMWVATNEGAIGGCERCGKCQVGAGHAGVTGSSFSPLRGTMTCARCHRTDQRLIGGNVCVSCYNRAREWLSGKNAKGSKPCKHPALERRVVRYVEDGVVRVMSRAHTVGMGELVVEVLRDSGKRVVFGRGLG